MESQAILSTADVPPQFWETSFLVGHVPAKALSSDPRVSYSLHIPPEHYHSPTDRLLLLVVVHGTDCTTSQLHNKLVPFSHSHKCAILYPLFPTGLDDPNDLDSYKVLSSRTLRSDLALFTMLEEVQQRWPGIDIEKVFMMGFSGGGQYAHRFLYLYPERLHAISVGAPGRVTELDENLPWPTGIKNVEEKFGKKVEKGNIKAVKNIQLVVGSKDTEIQGGKEYWVWLEERQRKSRTENRDESHEGSGLEPMRTGRVETLQDLQKSWAADGIETQLDIVPGVAHESAGVVDTVLDFFRPLITEVHRE